MARKDQVIQQIRFGLHELSARNGHHEFEELSRHLVRARLVTNVLPATGPVGAGGDQGRDFETFHTYLTEELGPHGWFLAAASSGPVAFTCTTQQENLVSKIKADVAKVMGSGEPVERIYALLTADMPVGVRHSLIDDIREEHSVAVEVLDGTALSELLADNDVQWIADRYLSLPLLSEDDPAESGTGQPAWYITLRDDWREKGPPLPTLGDVLDLSQGLRRATFHSDARPDLPFWLSLMAEIIEAGPPLPLTLQSARYEIVVATLRGQGTLRPVEGMLEDFISTALEGSNPAQLLDASVIQHYSVGAFFGGVTDLSAEVITVRNREIERRVLELLDEPPTRQVRAQLLQILGHIRSQPDVLKIPAGQSGDESYPDVTEWVGATGEVEQPDGVSPSPSDQDLLVDMDGAIDAWLELSTMLGEVPLFPVESMAEQLAFLTPMAVGDTRWDGILDAFDTAVELVAGGAAAAAIARDRAMALLQPGDYLGAIRDLHRAKVGWWSGDNLRGSLLAMGVLAHCYSEIGLLQASKQYGLGLATISMASGDDSLADLVARGLFAAADADYTAGAWCTASELLEAALHYQLEFVEHGLDPDNPTVQTAVLQLTKMIETARELAPALEPNLVRIAETFGFAETVNELLALATGSSTTRSIPEAAAAEGIGSPFSDAGHTRTIRYESLGLSWRITCANDVRTSRAAERFVSATQILVVELAQIDLALLPTTIDVDIVLASNDESPGVRSGESNEGRVWRVHLTGVDPGSSPDPEQLNIEILAVVSQILSEVSLLPTDEFGSAIEDAFRAGLVHKIGVGRAYDELASIVDEERFAETNRTSASASEGYPQPNSGLPWQDGPGPTFDKETATEFLGNRYSFFEEHLVATLPALRVDPDFQETVSTLRERGWLDWHILTGVFNVVVNHRMNDFSRSELTDPSRQKEIRESLTVVEKPDSEVLPTEAFGIEELDFAREVAMLSLVAHWDLECRQLTPDTPAIERFLAARYGYWTDDIPHQDPFDVS